MSNLKSPILPSTIHTNNLKNYAWRTKNSGNLKSTCRRNNNKTRWEEVDLKGEMKFASRTMWS